MSWEIGVKNIQGKHFLKCKKLTIFLLIILAVLTRKAYCQVDEVPPSKEDIACTDYAAKHRFPYQCDQRPLIDKRIRYELDILKRFPGSYLPYSALCTSYIKKGNWTKKLKEKIRYYKVSIIYAKKSIARYKDPEHIRWMEMKINFAKNEIAEIRANLKKSNKKKSSLRNYFMKTKGNL